MAITKIPTKKKMSVVCLTHTDDKGRDVFKKFGGISDIDVDATDENLFRLTQAVEAVLNYAMDYAHEAKTSSLSNIG